MPTKAYSKNEQLHTLGDAGEALTDKQGYAVYRKQADGEVYLADGTDLGLAPVYPLINDPAENSSAQVCISGITEVKLGGTVGEGDKLAPDSSAKWVVSTAGDSGCVIAMEDGVANDVIAAQVVPGASKGAVAVTVWISLTNADNNTVARFTAPFAGKIESMEASVAIVTTDTSGKKVVLNPAIGGTDCTGGSLTIDTDVAADDPDTAGKLLDATAITGANSFVAGDEIEIEAGNFTVFSDGSVNVTLWLVPNA